MLLSFDTETSAMDPVLAPPLVCGAFSDGSSAWLLNRKDTIDAFREALRGELTNVNVVFDLAVMVVADPALLPLVFQALEDGRIVSADINEVLHDVARERRWRDAEGREHVDCWLYIDDNGRDIGWYGQAFLERRYLGIDRSAEKASGWRFRYGELRRLPISAYPLEAVEYPKRDALNAWRINDAQRGHNNRDARPRWMRKAWAYYLQRAWGIRTDRERVDELRAAVTKMHDETVQRFTASGLYRGPGQINPRSKRGLPYPPSQYGKRNTEVLRERVRRAYHGRPPLTDGGEVSTDRDTLSESGDELLEQFAETGENEKLYSQYIDVLEAGTRRPIHFEFRFIKTGRPAAREPNLFNFPRDPRIRACVIPRPGYVFIDGDYSAIEFCTLAQTTYELFGRSAMRDALIADRDPHVLFAAQLANTDYASMLARVAGGDAQARGLRQLAKAWNYGKGGGMGVAKMVQTSRKQGVKFCVVGGVSAVCRGERLTEWNGREIKPTCIDCLRVAVRADDGYFTAWPEMRDYFDLITRETRGTGAIRGYAFTRAGCTFTNGSNFRFQHRAACLQADALWQLARECYVERQSPLFGCRPVITPYDQTLAEAPAHRASAAADRLAAVMRSAGERVCPDVPIKVEPVITRRWLKDARPNRVNGRLEVSDA